MESEIRMWMVISSNPVLVQGKEKVLKHSEYRAGSVKHPRAQKEAFVRQK